MNRLASAVVLPEGWRDRWSTKSGDAAETVLVIPAELPVVEELIATPICGRVAQATAGSAKLTQLRRKNSPFIDSAITPPMTSTLSTCVAGRLEPVLKLRSATMRSPGRTRSTQPGWFASGPQSPVGSLARSGRWTAA